MKTQAKEDQRSKEAQIHCKRLILDWFDKHNMVYLGSKYLNNGQRGLELVKNKLKLLVFEGMAKDEFQEVRGKKEWDKWIKEQVQEAIFNPTLSYNQVYGRDSNSSGGKSKLLEKLEKWKRGLVLAQGKGRTFVCPIDHPGVIKSQYLNMNTYESYSLWWNGGSLKNMRAYDQSIADLHESQILCSPGLDFEARKQLVVYRKNRAYLAWALMCIMDVVHKHNVLHNDINPKNVMLHFPRDRDGVIFIGVSNWGKATCTHEKALLNYKKLKVEMVKHKKKYNYADSKLFDIHGKKKTSRPPMKMDLKHRDTYLLESFVVGALAKKIYCCDSTSNLFQQNRYPNVVKIRFEQALDELTKLNPIERSTITNVVNTLKSPPYNMETPTMCFRNTLT